MPTNTADAQEPLYRALDAASEVAADLPGARITSMTVQVANEQQANTLRRYLKARVRAGGQVVGEYGGVEVAVEVRP
jgi:hypothetical protein